MHGPQIYLASGSPRRRALLDQIGIGYRVLPIEVPEDRRSGELPEDYVLRVALEKARAGQRALSGLPALPVLGADTAVVLDGDVLGKPRGRDEALEMLARLSGREHSVCSGIAMVAHRESVRLSVSRVRFREISEAERRAYWATGEPVDKAGAYAIQGRAAVFIARLEGSFSGVMGLPLFETAALLREFAIPFFDPADNAGEP